MNPPALLVAPMLVCFLFVGWLLVQRLWRRIFELADRADVLAGRCSCASCPTADVCQSTDLEEKSHVG